MLFAKGSQSKFLSKGRVTVPDPVPKAVHSQLKSCN